MTALRRHEIVSPGGALRAQFAPGAGMVCCSLRADGRELLAERHGLRAYAERGSTLGIPLLYPWANRLDGDEYEVAGRRVTLPAGSPLLPRDPHGLPIHGVLPGRLRWTLVPGLAGSSTLAATLRWDEPELLELFPFAHRLEYVATLHDDALEIAVTVHAGEQGAVPVSFGFHPYLLLPAGARAGAEVELPAHERLALDARMIPSGAREPFAAGRRRLGARDWDDAFAGPEPPAVAALLAAGERTELDLLEGFRFSQLYAPQDADFACIEPMTAPTNALVSGAAPLVEPGASFRASFSIRPGVSP